MSEIDRQRIAAVSTLQALGYTYRFGRWHPPLHTSRGMRPEADALHSRLVAIADKMVENPNSWDDDDLEAVGEALEAYEAIRWPDGKVDGGKG